jgi:arsenate reductase (thioredoxin)
MSTNSIKILILCTGNSCRSQMARSILQSFDNKIEVHSAGTYTAAKVNPKAIEVMAEAGIDISKSTPKSVDEFLNDQWDYVITACDNAKETYPVFTGKVKNRLYIGFEDPSHVTGSEVYIMSEFRRIRDETKDTFLNFYKSEIKPNR